MSRIRVCRVIKRVDLRSFIAWLAEAALTAVIVAATFGALMMIGVPIK